MLRNFLFVLLGLFGGLWIAWPGISDKGNWICAKEIVMKSKEERTDIRAVLAISPKYLMGRKRHAPMDQLRIVGDACFR